MARWKRGGLVGAAVLAAATAVAVPALTGDDTADAAATISTRQPSVTSVTLITGDRVVLYRTGKRENYRVEPGDGRRHITFQAYRDADSHLHVVPSDALRLIGQGRLDPRLFDVTTLVEYGYHDAARKDLPLLVQGESAQGVAPLADDAGGAVTRRLSSVDAVAVRQPKAHADELWAALTSSQTMRSAVTRVWLDGKRKALLDNSVPQIGTPTAWDAGLTGKGVTVAVLDSGIDATHPDFEGRIGEVRNFTEAPDANDTVGHGTHVASTVAGTGAASDGRYKGVAPEATLLIGKVCEDEFCADSAILAGMEWAAQSGADIVNMSLGSPDTPEIDPLEQAVNTLTAEYGTLFVIAAGNEGNGDETVSSPASADAALAVGAVDKDDQLAGFSSRGPRVGDAALKPEIVAPGVEIVAANAKDGFMGEPGEPYTTMSGTSMATPHVAGAAALLAQQHPDWKADTLKAALVGSAKRLPKLGAYAQGAGRLDIARAISHPGYTSPSVVSAGLMSWPHDDDEPVTRTVTYHNPTDEPVTYQLEVTSLGPDGNPAPEGIFSLSVDEVTVPAGGTATVDVTVNTRMDTPDGYYSAWLAATAAEATVTTPIAVHKEPETYSVTVNITDRSGAPAHDYEVVVASLDSSRFWDLINGDGSHTLRLPKGRYHIVSWIYEFDDNGNEVHASLLTNPVYTVTEDSSVALDMRAAKPLSMTFDRRGVRQELGNVSYYFEDTHSEHYATLMANDFSGASTAHLGSRVARDKMVSEVSGWWAIPDDSGDVRRSQHAYHLAYYTYGELFTGFSKSVREKELAAVKTTYHSDIETTGMALWSPNAPGIEYGTGLGLSMTMPITRTEYHNTDGVEWRTEVWQDSPDGPFPQVMLRGDGPLRHQPGRTYTQHWNNAVVGPAFTKTGGDASRTEDEILIAIPVHGDGSGHPGFSDTDSARTVLYRDGEKVGETPEPGFGEFSVPAEEAEYRLTADAERSVSAYSTRISCVWTFRSGHTAEREALPLMTVGFTPKVDESNRAEAGKRQRVPVTVRTVGGKAAAVDSLTVEVSFDDGKTWKQVRVTAKDGKWFAEIAHPADATHVSLRATAVDEDGSTVEETIIRAYGLK